MRLMYTAAGRSNVFFFVTCEMIAKNNALAVVHAFPAHMSPQL